MLRECDRIAKYIERIADGCATADEYRAVTEHVAGCPKCGRLFDTTLALLGELGKRSPPAPPEDLASRVMARIEQGEFAPVSPRPRAPLALAAAAIVAVAFGVLFFALREVPQPPSVAPPVPVEARIDALEAAYTFADCAGAGLSEYFRNVLDESGQIAGNAAESVSRGVSKIEPGDVDEERIVETLRGLARMTLSL